MASIKVPSNVSSMTFATSGVKTPTAQIISGLTAGEATAFASQFTQGVNAVQLISTAANGAVLFSFPTVITSITINSIAYAVNGAVTPWGRLLASAVPAPAATICKQEGFLLVTG